MRYLQKVRIFPGNKGFTLIYKSLNPLVKGKENTIHVRGSKEAFRTFLMKCQASDTMKDPPSLNRVKRYIDMVNDAISGRDHVVYIFSHMLPKQSVVTLSESCKESFFDSDISVDKFLKKVMNDDKEV